MHVDRVGMCMLHTTAWPTQTQQRPSVWDVKQKSIFISCVMKEKWKKKTTAELQQRLLGIPSKFRLSMHV